MAILDGVDKWPEVPEGYALDSHGFRKKEKKPKLQSAFFRFFGQLVWQVPAWLLAGAFVSFWISVWALVRIIRWRKERQPVTINYSPLGSGPVISRDDKDPRP